jgi:trehalose/maltose hydrolase-like predicted phosphorylase
VAARWRELAAGLVDGYDPVTRRHEQFAGFWGLEPLRITQIATVPVAADVLLGQARVARSQVLKQPDVLMAHHLVPAEMPAGSLAADLDFYLPLTAHGSSLSPAVCASLLARAGRPDEALDLFGIAANVDLGDLSGTTGGGLHLATMGGLWQAVVRGFAGVRPDGDVLRIDPHLPERWRRLRIRLCFRGVPLRIEMTHDWVTIDADGPVRTDVHGVTLESSGHVTLRDGTWRIQ